MGLNNWEYKPKFEHFIGDFRKKGLISKKYEVTLDVYPRFIKGFGFGWSWDNNTINDEQIEFNIRIFDIRTTSIIYIDGIKAIKVEYKKVDDVLGSNHVLVLPNLPDCDKAITVIKQAKDVAEQDIISERKLLEENFIKQQEEQKARQDFFDKCYEFHIGNKQRPTFELNRSNLQVAVIYIDEDKNFNFLRIDGVNKEESNGIIAFSKLHYYEKAGNIHYTTNISGKYSNFGGSFTGNTFSKKATFWGGLLFGTMGLAAGALFTQKPAEFNMPDTNFSIDSEVQKIDDRNVIINYYSDAHKQFIDIELPAEIYNFLQTYLPEKKYGIVMELEKETAIKQSKAQIENGSYLKIPNSNIEKKIGDRNQQIEPATSMSDFKQKMEKLKTMYECGILNDEEFMEEKKKILSSL